MDQKTNIPGLFRTENNALINKDNGSLEAYRKKRHAARQVQDMSKQIQDLLLLVKHLEERIIKLEQ